METKGAIGLSVNILVVIIISLVILAGGVALLYKFIGGAEELKGHLDERTNQELERLLIDQGKPVALPLHVANLFPGESHVFGIGILNTESDPDQFELKIELSKFVDEEGNVRTDDVREAAEKWLLYNTQTMKILENEHRKEAILVSVPNDAEKGQYIFNVQIRDDNEQQYGNTQKFTVNVA